MNKILKLLIATLFFLLIVSCRESSKNKGKEQMNNESRKANHLINEKSPYLLQHAYNPVDWYPWGEEAFEKARRENKPIFLSIG